MINRNLNYQHLYYFMKIVDLGSVTKAAAFLSLGQPAVSMQIKIFEDQLQVQLFTRKNKKLILTDAGKVIYEYSKQIFNLGSEMLTTIENRELQHVKIKIGIHDCVPKNLISKLTTFIYKKFNAEICLINGTSDEVSVNLLSHNIDLAVLNHSPYLNDKINFNSKKILKSPIILVGSKEFIKLKNKPFKSFSNIPLILPTKPSILRNKVELLFRNNNLKINLIGESQDTMVQKNMAISGNGVVPIMKDAVDAYVKDKKLYVLQNLHDLFEEIWIVSNKRIIQNPIVQKIWDDFDLN